MGKKRITGKTEQEILKETEERETAEKKTAKAKEPAKLKRIEAGRIYIQSTYNNTVITITDNVGSVLTWASSGAVGFKGPKKATPFAATKVVGVLMERIRKIGFRRASIFVRGVGSGREAAIRAFINQGLEIDLIKDMTPVPHNGCRPRKVRRV